MRRRFFVERFENGSAVLRGESARHLERVLRAQTGQLYELSDGEAVWLAKIKDIGRDNIEFALLQSLPVGDAPLKITLLLAVVKFDHFEWAIEKATELGVDELIPLAAQRSEKRLVDACVKRAARWERILVESSQQSRRSGIPELRAAVPTLEAFSAANHDVRLLLSERPDARPMRDLLEPAAALAAGKRTKLAIAIGPEGGWTDGEFDAGSNCGFSEAAIGSNILRTETAVCAALAAAQYAFGAFRRGDVLEDLHSESSEERT
jgi:16S rRNA (uracil1498-N3)-methyltransferase